MKKDHFTFYRHGDFQRTVKTRKTFKRFSVKPLVVYYYNEAGVTHTVLYHAIAVDGELAFKSNGVTYLPCFWGGLNELQELIDKQDGRLLSLIVD